MNNNFQNNLEKILKIEKLIGISHDINSPKARYFHPENYLWIKKVKWPFETYQLLSKATGISAFPEKRLKEWSKVFKNKGKGLKKRIGLFFKVPFLKTHKLPICSDFYFNKNNFGILIYTKIEKPKVIKFIQSDNVKHFGVKLQNEINSLKIANKIIHKKVHTSKLTSSYNQENIFYFEQELIIGQDLHFLSKNRLENIYNQVFDFMYFFYLQNEIKIIRLSECNYITNIEVQNYIRNLECGDYLIEKYNQIKTLDKKAIICTVHGDLSLNNILIDKQNKIFIIDWGESEENFIANDLRNFPKSSVGIFEKIINYKNFNKDSLYSFEEHIFISDFHDICKLIYNNLINNQYDPYFTGKLNNHISRLHNYLKKV